jgi:hypothetical protein
MYDICNNCVVYNFLPYVTNNAVHGHITFTRSSTNLHRTTVSSIDKHILFIIVLLLGIDIL